MQSKVTRLPRNVRWQPKKDYASQNVSRMKIFSNRVPQEEMLQSVRWDQQALEMQGAQS
jgi:hypothetical protein